MAVTGSRVEIVNSLLRDNYAWVRCRNSFHFIHHQRWITACRSPLSISSLHRSVGASAAQRLKPAVLRALLLLFQPQGEVTSSPTE